MTERVPGGWRRIWKWFLNFLAVDPGPSNLAESVADRLFDKLTPEQRTKLRMRFGVDADTSATLDEIAAQFSKTRRRIREIESQALIRLYRWKYRKSRAPAVQGRLLKRIADAHDNILNALCDTPPIRSVLVGWHDQLVDGRRSACEIAKQLDPDTEDGLQSPETILAAKLRKALWANARARKPVRGTDGEPETRTNERDKALACLRDLRLNARSILAIAEALLSHARPIEVESDEMTPQLLAPVFDPDAPSPPGIPPDPASHFHGEMLEIAELDAALADAVTAEAGMPVDELWTRAYRVDQALTTALHIQRLLADSCMPLVAEIAVGQGLRGKEFFEGIEKGRAAVRELADHFCFSTGGDFTVQAEQAIRTVLESGEPDEKE